MPITITLTPAELLEITASAKAAMSAAKTSDFTNELITEILQACPIEGQDIKTIVATPAGSETLSPALCKAAKAVRLGGILPYYTARALACHFFSVGDWDKKYICTNTGFEFEMELIQDIHTCAAQLSAGESILQDEKTVALLKKVYELGYHYEKVYRGCAQCTLLALFDAIGHKDADLFRITNTFAAGMGLFGDGVCGGYSGGLLFLGKYAGRRLEFIDGDKEEKDRAMMLCEKLHTKFIDTYGSVTCHDIHRDIFGRAFHIRKTEDKEGFEEAGAHTDDKCTAVVGTAAMYTAQVLLDTGMITA